MDVQERRQKTALLSDICANNSLRCFLVKIMECWKQDAFFLQELKRSQLMLDFLKYVKSKSCLEVGSPSMLVLQVIVLLCSVRFLIFSCLNSDSKLYTLICFIINIQLLKRDLDSICSSECYSSISSVLTDLPVSVYSRSLCCFLFL